VRHDSKALQHSEAVALLEMSRLLAGSEDWTMSTNKFWKSALPICGVWLDVAPGGVQMVKPVSQPPAEFSPAAATIRAARIAK